jgi:hypothetical protein
LEKYRDGRAEAPYAVSLLEGLHAQMSHEGRKWLFDFLWGQVRFDFEKAVKGESAQHWIFELAIPFWVELGDTAVLTKRLLELLVPQEPGVGKAWATHISGQLCHALGQHSNRFADSTITRIQAFVGDLKFAANTQLHDYQPDPDLGRALNRINQIINDWRFEPVEKNLLAARNATQSSAKLGAPPALSSKPSVRVMRDYPDPTPGSLNEGHAEPDSTWDLFICHASEDKESFVRPLAERLQANGIRVWYDEFALKVGDRLRQSIDRGLKSSRFGVVVLSPAFLQKNWPQYELDGLAQRELGGKKVILPVWHNLSEPDVRQYSPSLAGRVAALSVEGMEAVIKKLLDAMGAASQSQATAASASKEAMTMQILRAVFSKDKNGFILTVEFRSTARESEQLTKWTLEFPSLRVVLPGGPGPANLLTGAAWLPVPPFDIPGRKITVGSVFFSGSPNFMGKLPTEPVTATLTAHLFPATDPLRQSVDIDYIKTQLRNHQKLIFNGTASWPPIWREKDSGRFLQGELGTLTNVRKGLPQYEVPQYLTLESKFSDQVWESQLRADDQDFLAGLYERLRSGFIGKSLNEVGSLELP